MSLPYNGNAMDRPPPTAGSVKRARERALAGLPREPPPPSPMRYKPSDADYPPQQQAWPIAPSPKSNKPRVPRNLDGQSISRPTPIPQWPLAGPLQSPVDVPNLRPFRPADGLPQKVAPPRPPRPSKVPSMLDQSRIQEPTPVFLSPNDTSESSRALSQEFGSSAPPTPSSRLTTSSVGSIPDFPAPATTTLPRRSVNLGPPPSSRRGMSSYYSTTSNVSPIPEESPLARSHRSYASSAAMPDNWGVEPSPASSSSFGDAFYEESISDTSRDSVYIEDFGDESNLVRSASVGKKGKPSLITTRTASSLHPIPRPGPSPVQSADEDSDPQDISTSSSNTLPMARQRGIVSPGMNALPTEEFGAGPNRASRAWDTAPVSEFADVPERTRSPEPYSDRSAMRRPPRLDIDAVRTAEARGSLTSLPDLIRRATKLAAMIDRGKRPASRFDDLRDFLAAGDRTEEKDAVVDDRHRSGLSDMLAAFPPPVQATRQPPRGSWFRTTSWPLAPGGRQETRRAVSPPPQSPDMDPGVSKEAPPPRKQRRRCCGLPMWAFFLILALIIAIIAVAIIIPLQFFVFKTLGNQQTPEKSLNDCRTTLVCQNGGTNVVSQGVCACICTNGFSGSDCTASRSDACTTTNLVSSDSSKNINNVTLGRAIPRLIADASGNFSIPLSGTAILAKLNTASLSCIAQNSLVTFNRQSTRIGDGSAEAQGVPISLITASPGEILTLTVSSPSPTTITTTNTGLPLSGTLTVPPLDSQTAPTNTAPPAPTTTGAVDSFIITEEMLDFARVAVLFVLQQQTPDTAVTAQTNLQRFFSEAKRLIGDAARQAAANIDIGGNNKVNLVAFTVDVGNGPVGRGVSKRAELPLLQQASRGRRGGSSLPRR